MKTYSFCCNLLLTSGGGMCSYFEKYGTLTDAYMPKVFPVYFIHVVSSHVKKC